MPPTERRHGDLYETNRRILYYRNKGNILKVKVNYRKSLRRERELWNEIHLIKV